MVDLEFNIQMWRALGTKPPVFNRSYAHAEAQASRSCALVSAKKASHPVSGSGRDLQHQDIFSSASVRRIKYLKHQSCMGNI